MINAITRGTSACSIHVMIEFLLIILSDVPKVVIRHDKLFVLMARVEALTKEVFILLLNLEESTKHEENMKETSGASLNLLENIEILKEDLKNVFLKAPADSSQLCFPTSDGPLFVTFLLRNLKDFLNSNSSTVASIKEEIRWVKEDLELVRSFFGKVEKELNRDLWASVLDMAYEAEHALNSIIVRDNGFEEEKEWIFRKLTSGPADVHIISIVGMPGIGKTTLDDRVYNDKSIVGHFDVCSWCTVDQEHNEKNLFQKIFNQVIGSKERFNKDGIDDNVADNLCKQLFGNRYLIVLDDLWDTATWDELTRPFPSEFQKGSRVILKSRKNAEGLMEQSEVMVYVDELISSSLVVVSNERDLMPHGMTVHYDQHFPLSDVNFFLLSEEKENPYVKCLLSLTVYMDDHDGLYISYKYHLRHLRLLKRLELPDITLPDFLLNEIGMLVHLKCLNILTEAKTLPPSFSNL
ncbi:hypothetical protein CQW23_12826 [Capsicum baccatum]|uniref:NB-ARC domain-containing protein n=1 Tax=Capsicum baccatum TaxID=33114 RepID=A0A2G2WTM8_CAPBA|nr:hypothetical protein CQW23_12826 [Capsicum baccatum]